MSDIIFSVLVITYNQEQYISQTLDSILQQKHNYKYEIVIGDDCSSDNTREIIKQYVNRYPDVIKPIYNEKNLGVIGNYFNVLKNCTGKYIMECAGDDYWLPSKVKTQIEFMETHNSVGLCYGMAKTCDCNNKVLSTIVGGDSCTFKKLLDCNQIPALTVCLKKELSDIYLDEIKPVEKKWKAEDYPMWLWMSQNTTISFIKSYLGVYRVIDNSVSHSNEIEKQVVFYENMWEIRKFFSMLYKIEIEPFDRKEIWNNVAIATLFKKYDSSIAGELKNRLKASKSIKNSLKSIIISNQFFFCVYRFFRGIK